MRLTSASLSGCKSPLARLRAGEQWATPAQQQEQRAAVWTAHSAHTDNPLCTGSERAQRPLEVEPLNAGSQRRPLGSSLFASPRRLVHDASQSRSRIAHCSAGTAHHGGRTARSSRSRLVVAALERTAAATSAGHTSTRRARGAKVRQHGHRSRDGSERAGALSSAPVTHGSLFAALRWPFCSALLCCCVLQSSPDFRVHDRPALERGGKSGRDAAADHSTIPRAGARSDERHRQARDEPEQSGGNAASMLAGSRLTPVCSHCVVCARRHVQRRWTRYDAQTLACDASAAPLSCAWSHCALVCVAAPSRR